MANYTTDEASKLLGVSVRRVVQLLHYRNQRRAAEGLPPIGRKFGRAWLLTDADITVLRPGRPGRPPAHKQASPPAAEG